VLAGIVVKNGILVIDLQMTACKRITTREAAIQAGKTRSFPVLLLRMAAITLH